MQRGESGKEITDRHHESSRQTPDHINQASPTVISMTGLRLEPSELMTTLALASDLTNNTMIIRLKKIIVHSEDSKGIDVASLICSLIHQFYSSPLGEKFSAYQMPDEINVTRVDTN